jgi:ubiquinone/menaquinone biosynthesis C-methylase UbiE
MRSPQTVVPPRQRIASAFGRKAAMYESHAEVQSELTALLASKLAASGLSGGRWVDLGCGTGMLADACGRNGLSCSVLVGVDIAFEPLLVYKKKRIGSSVTVQADIGRLPLKNGMFDAAVIASTLQWLDNVPQALKNISAILRKGGLLAFSVFIQGSFRELFSVQRRFGVPMPVQCPETAGFAATLYSAGFEAVDYEIIERVVHAPTAGMVLKNISAVGSTATAAFRLLNRKEVAALCSAYESDYRDGIGVPLTYRAALGVCRKGRQP